MVLSSRKLTASTKYCCLRRHRYCLHSNAAYLGFRLAYTHEAMAKGEVLKDFVEAVANDPEGALARVGIQTKHLALDQYPGTHVHFRREQYDDFFEVVQWVPEIEPREHDAAAVTLIMRLREALAALGELPQATASRTRRYRQA
jgi:hypothetical protein